MKQQEMKNNPHCIFAILEYISLPERSLKVTKVLSILALTQPFPYWMVSHSPSLSLTPSLYPSLSPSFARCKHLSTHRELFLYIYMRRLFCRLIFKKFQIFWSNYDLDLQFAFLWKTFVIVLKS